MHYYESAWKIAFGAYAVLMLLLFIIVGPLDSLFVSLWIGGGIAGLFLLAQKGRLFKFGAFGFQTWLLIGWWAVILFIILGPLTWLVGLFLEPRQECPSCRQEFSAKLSMCPHCGFTLPME